MTGFTTVNWKKMSPETLDNVLVVGKLTLAHSHKSKTTIDFSMPTAVSAALRMLTERQNGQPRANPKITGHVKLLQCTTVNNMQLGPLVGETVSRFLNHAPARGWIYVQVVDAEENEVEGRSP